VRGLTWKNQSEFTDPGAAGAVIDELPADLADLAGRDELRVPATVTSFGPFGGPPREVTLRP